MRSLIDRADPRSASPLVVHYKSIIAFGASTKRQKYTDKPAEPEPTLLLPAATLQSSREPGALETCARLTARFLSAPAGDAGIALKREKTEMETTKSQ